MSIGRYREPVFQLAVALQRSKRTATGQPIRHGEHKGLYVNCCFAIERTYGDEKTCMSTMIQYYKDLVGGSQGEMHQLDWPMKVGDCICV